MAAIKVPTAFNIDVEFEIPEFYRRLLATLIDLLILYVYLRVAAWIVNSIAASMYSDSDDYGYNISAISILFIAMPILAYHLVMEVTLNGQSIGKKITRIKVVNENGGRASFSQFMIRWLLRDIWFLMLLAVSLGDANLVWVIFFLVFGYFTTEIVLVVASKKSQRLGDLLAHTILIRTSTKADIDELVFQEVSDTYVPSYPQIMQLSDKDINAIKNILGAARRKGDFDMASRASEKIKAHLQISTTLSPFEFLEILLKDYNYLSVK